MKKIIDEKSLILEKQIVEYQTKYLRALADYQNLEKRTVSENEEARKYAQKYLIVKLLHVLDGLEKAEKHLKDEGLSLVIKDFHKVLDESELVHIEVIGKNFDPHEMECIEVCEGEDNIVIDEIRPGYRMFDKIVRPAQVKVGKKTVENNQK
jgi:molecular chaperone GrpE